MDAIFLEGSKIFYRAGLGILSYFEKKLLQCTSFARMEAAIIEGARSPSFELSAALEKGFKFPISRSEILQYRFRLMSQVEVQLMVRHVIPMLFAQR